MSIQTIMTGSYPKPPPEGAPFSLRKTLHAMERGEADERDLQRARQELAAEVIAEQEEAGLDVVTDGHVGWDDILTPFARNLAGFSIGGLLRWFDNNVYYRRPICTGPVEWRGPSSVDGWAFAQSVAHVPVKAVIPGPITFAHLSVDDHYGDRGEFVGALASVLAQEAFELEAAGATIIQIDEPALLNAPEDLAIAKASLGLITSQLQSATTIVCTYFGDAKRLGPELWELPADCFGLDFVAGPGNAQLVDDMPKDKVLQAGIVDARNTALEPTADLLASIEPLFNTLGDRLSVGPSAGLEFLPREKAKAKLERLVEAAKAVAG
ncbi:MAG: hypothetical protein M3360_01800 [Actinomycetota bacterium]|nr:hypothetical protein [Actinomycetota bacterium]